MKDGYQTMGAGKHILKKLENAFRLCCVKVLGWFHISLSEKQWNRWMQFIKFGLVGVSSTIINYGVYLLLIYFGVYYILANFIGFVISVINSFLWNNHFVFQNQTEEPSHWFFTFIKVFLSYAITGLGLNSILLFFWVDILHLSQALAPLAAMVITVPTNFLMNKLWAYKDNS